MISRQWVGSKGSIKSQLGMTLVEVLVTAVVMSVGLLGVAALHLTSLRNSTDSNSRSKAVWLAHDIADRMRANRDNAVTGNLYATTIGASAPTGTSIAATDLQQWKAALASLLTSGDGQINQTPVGSTTIFTITVQWTEHLSNDTNGKIVQGQPVQFVMQTEI